MSRTPADRTITEIIELIAIDTTSRDSNLPLIDLVAGRLLELGVPSTLVPDETGKKANLLATFPAADGSTSGGVVLSAHTDVVPVDGQDWSSDPFAAEVRDGRLYGRGACDMKSFIGVILAKLPDIAAQPLQAPIHLALSYDEEVGCIGAIGLVEAIVAADLKPTACVVGEPTSMEIVRGHKSINVIRVDFHGVAAHSSLTPKGVNAIAHAAEFVRFVHEVAAQFETDGPFESGYVVPFTTTTVNLIGGGIAVNTLPADCSLTFEFRSIEAVDLNELTEKFRAEAKRIEAKMQQAKPSARIDFTVIASAPGLSTADDAPILDRVAGWGAQPSSAKVTFGTEAGLFDLAGIPTVVCGPGDIAQAHAPNEFIELEQIALCEDFIDQIISDARA